MYTHGRFSVVGGVRTRALLCECVNGISHTLANVLIAYVDVTIDPTLRHMC